MTESSDVSLLRQLEESLWRSETRFDRSEMSRVLAADSLEFGRSSRIYRREDALTVERQEIPAKLPLVNLEIRFVHPDVALVTYESDVAYPSGRERARRSSLWTRTQDGWQLRFHQGTPHTASSEACPSERLQLTPNSSDDRCQTASRGGRRTR